jgi:cell division protein FtsI (penicillin-binding protein 3)
MFNRASLGDYEMGSTFKLFNTAAALDAGTSTLSSTYDVTHKIKIARFEIYDYEPEHHPLTVAEILKVSSNIGSARMALDLGIENQKAFMTRMGLTRPTAIELPEVSSPLVPNPWREINSMTIAYGHGMAVSPLHMMTGVSALVNGGLFHPATLLKHNETDQIPFQRVIKTGTSKIMRDLMRMVVVEGTGKKADVPGYEVGGKTGTAEKNSAGGYHHKTLLSSFVSTFPVSDPKYVVLVMIDEPQGNKESFGFATAGWTAAPAVGRVIAQIGPLLGLPPSATPEEPAKDKSHVAQAPSQKGVTFAKAE